MQYVKTTIKHCDELKYSGLELTRQPCARALLVVLIEVLNQSGNWNQFLDNSLLGAIVPTLP